jgi:hypothetical protein
MNSMTYQILPYEAKYNDALMALEHLTPQGKKIKLEMLRPSFLSRSEVFEKYSIYVAVDQTKDSLIGVAGVSIVPVKYEDSFMQAGFGYDLKIEPAHRKKGLAKKFGKILVDGYLINNDISNYFITLKTGNEGAAKAVYVIPKQWYTYNFLYLTIPTFKRIKSLSTANRNQFLSTELLSRPANAEEYIIETESGLSIWKTYKTYQLKIKDMPFFMNLGIKLANLIGSKGKKMPHKGHVLKFATLFNYNPKNIVNINEALEILHNKNIQYLNVCCTKEDLTYELLRPYAINSLPYTMLNTFKVQNGHHLTLDVRCL